MSTLRQTIFDNFTDGINPRWTQTIFGGASLSSENAKLRLALQAVEQGTYTDAQIDDYGKLSRANFPWRPPLRMEVRARSSHPAVTPSNPQEQVLQGTAGFGFWNYPFSVRGDAMMLPEAVWFFYASPPSNMALVPGVPGLGWKAQVVHSMRKGALLATLPTALSIGWGKITGDTRSAARWVQRVSGAQEALLTVDMTDWQTYTLEWRETEVRFQVNGVEVLCAPRPPTRPLGFVAWLDNQYAMATPAGVIRFGTVASGPQWLEMESIRIEPI